MNVRSLPQRLGTSSVVVIGIAGVVAVLISVLAMSAGFIRTLQKTGPESRAIVVGTGASTELVSVLSKDSVSLIADSSGIAKGANGQPLASAETVLIVNLNKRNGDEASAPVRGFTDISFAVHPEIKLTQGRLFKRGLTQIIVGKSAQRLYRGIDVGSQIKLQDSIWTVVGAFESNGSARESELIADEQTLNSAFHRGSGASSVWVVLDPAGGFQPFKDAITSNPRLQVEASTEKDFETNQSDQINRILSLVAYVLGGIMAIGAIFGALNTMYSAVSVRSREIATLRAIGFGPVPVVISVLLEALLLALMGGLIGALIAWGLFNGLSVDSVGGGFGGQLIFELAVTPELVAIGFLWACGIGMIGGLFPAMRAARLPVATALRAA